MKRFGVVLSWASFMVVAGLFLLLKNLGVLGIWGDLVWGGLYVLAGLGFLAWFLFDFARWWRVLPGFTLLSVGGLLLAQWRGIPLGDWRSALVILGIGLGFWVILLVRKENWWALIPAGVLTVVGVLLGLEAQMSEFDWLAVLFFGLGLVFVLLYVMRLGQSDTRWAAIPAAALILLGIVTLLSAINAPSVVLTWWPILLVVGGIGLTLGLLSRRQPVEPVVALPEQEEILPAPGASVSESIPEAVPESMDQEAAPEPVAEAEIDIYGVLAQQPAPEQAESSQPAGVSPTEGETAAKEIQGGPPPVTISPDEGRADQAGGMPEELTAEGSEDASESTNEEPAGKRSID